MRDLYETGRVAPDLTGILSAASLRGDIHEKAPE